LPVGEEGADMWGPPVSEEEEEAGTDSEFARVGRGPVQRLGQKVPRGPSSHFFCSFIFSFSDFWFYSKPFHNSSK
jgi:hypothetical protein